MVIQRIRVRFQKKGELKAISHLDLMRAFERALRRTGLPLRMSEGFNPHPRISFPAPLGVGIEGTDEVMEFELAEWAIPLEVERRLREQLPEGLGVLRVELGHPEETARVQELTYSVTPREPLRGDGRLDDHAIEQFLKRGEMPTRRTRKGREKVVDIRPFLLGCRREGDTLLLQVKSGPEGSTRPEEILEALGFDAEQCRTGFHYVRTQVQVAN